MSKGYLKEKARAQKKEQRIRTAKRKKSLLIAVLAIVLALVASFSITSLVRRNQVDVYSLWGQRIELFGDGRFTATMAHHVQRGKHTIITKDGQQIVEFTTRGSTVSGILEGDALHLPPEWDDGHGHGDVFYKEE